MHRITLDAEASQVSAELARRGTAAGTRVHVLAEVVGEQPDTLPIAAIAQAGGALGWLAEEPDLYTDADLVQPPQRADKLATLDPAVIAGKLGDAPAAWLDSHRTTFFSVFGFEPP